MDYELQVVLPFGQDEYEETFEGPGYVQEFRSLLGTAKSVFRLNADFCAQDLGYRTAGELVISQADLLVAVWDGKPAHGIGGTGEMVKQALEAGIPVIHINSSKPSDLTWLDAQGAQTPALHFLQAYIADLFHSSDAHAVEGRGDLCGENTGEIPRLQSVTLVKPRPDTAHAAAQEYLHTEWPGRPDPTAYMFALLFSNERLCFPRGRKRKTMCPRLKCVR